MDPRKNLHRTIAAYSALGHTLCREYPLVIQCRVNEQDRRALEMTAEREGVRDSVVITDHVTDDILRSLYQHARLVVVSSTYEGFGLPVVEALACHTDVIVGDNSSLREIVPDPNRRFDSSSTQAITDAIRRGLARNPLSGEEFDAWHAPFTWDRVALMTRSAIDELTSTRTRSKHKPRVAWIGPLPPQHSGIAKHTETLVAELKPVADVTTFGTGPKDTDADSLVARFEALENGDGSFDAVVVQMGNSIFHMSSLDFLRRHPGRCTVELHDVRLTGLYREIRRHRSEPSLRKMIVRWYGPEYLHRLERSGSLDDGLADEIWLTREVLRLAREVIVHSDEAAALCRLEDPGCAVRVVPLPLRQPPKNRPGKKTATIVSIGAIADSKDPRRLIEAVAAIRKRGINATLIFAGSGTLDATNARSTKSLNMLRTDGAVEEIGQCSEAKLWKLLQSASCVVQLRLTTNGESSAAVCDAISAGASVIADPWSVLGLPDGLAHVLHGTTVDELAEALATHLTATPKETQQPLWISTMRLRSPALIGNQIAAISLER